MTRINYSISFRMSRSRTTYYVGETSLKDAQSLWDILSDSFELTMMSTRPVEADHLWIDEEGDK